MENLCLVNKKTVSANRELKQAQKSAKRYYEEGYLARILARLARKNHKLPRAKVRKFTKLEKVLFQEYKLSSRTVGIETTAFNREELIALCKKTELRGQSGNGFLTYKKLERFTAKNGVLLINGVECDPGLVQDAWIYQNYLEQVEQGAKLVMHAMGITKAVLATKEPLQKKKSAALTQVKVIDRFPMGYENALIKEVLAIDILEGKHPVDYGILVMNIQTVFAIGQIASDETVAHERYITVANISKAKTIVTKVALGDSISDIAKFFFTEEEKKRKQIYVGSGAMNVHIAKKDEKVADETFYIAIGNAPDYENSSKCKGCGACSRNCPAGVTVHKIVKATENGSINTSVAKANCADLCINCGACTYGCPAGKDVRKVVKCAQKI